MRACARGDVFLGNNMTSGKRESVSWQNSMNNRREPGMLIPLRDINEGTDRGGITDDTCDQSLSRSWKVKVKLNDSHTFEVQRQNMPQADLLHEESCASRSSRKS